MKTIITTVGTSIFENCRKEEIKKLFEGGRKQTPKRPYFDTLNNHVPTIINENKSAKDYSSFISSTRDKEIRAEIEMWLMGVSKDESKKWKFTGITEHNIYASAEIQSVHKIITETLEDKDKSEETFSVYLLSSDTLISVFAANIIKEKLITLFPNLLNEDNIYIEVIEKCNMGLEKIDSDEIFQNLITKLSEITVYYHLKGFIGSIKKNGKSPKLKESDLLFYNSKIENNDIPQSQRKKIEEIRNYIIQNKPEPPPEKGFEWNTFLKKYIDKANVDFIFNIAGGYKGLIPYITIISQLWKMPIFYLFEDSEEEVIINNLPIQYDTNRIEQLYPYLNNNYLKNVSEITKKTKVKEQLLIHGLVKEGNGKVLNLTPFGKLFNQYVILKDTNASSVFGAYAEYKFYEYFLENEYQSMSFVKHSKKFENSEGKPLHEIDLQLTNEKDKEKGEYTQNVEFILVEIKSFFQVYKNIEEIIETAKKRILFYEKTYKKKPKEYILAFYKNDFHDENIVKTLVDDFISKVTETTVKVIFTDIKLEDNEKSSTNTYIKFAQKALSKEEVKDFRTQKPLIL